MVELIQRGEPALMLCHWPGMYCNGTKIGFKHFQDSVVALDNRFRDQTIWMKLSEIARYWAAKELTRIRRRDGKVMLQAPFASPYFTLRIKGAQPGVPKLFAKGKPRPLRQASRLSNLSAGTWLRDKDAVLVCFDLPKGRSTLELPTS